MTDKPSRRNPAWTRFLLVWALILLLLGGTCCYVLYRFLGVYEVTRPDPVMKEYMENNSIEDLVHLAEKNIDLELTEFEDPQDLYTSYIDAIDLTRALNYRVNSEKSTEDNMVYDVRCGPNLICQVVLNPDGASPGFNRNYWTVSEVCAARITDLLPSVTAVIEAVSGTELELNGKPLSNDYLSGKPFEIPDLTRFESESENPPVFLTYEVGPLYGDIQLSDLYGNSIPPDSDVTDHTIHYQTFTGTQDLVISAPEDLAVYINGVQLGRRDASSSTLGVFEGLEPYMGDASCLTNVYKVSGLYVNPVVTAMELDGKEVTPIASAENSFTFFHKGEPETEAEMLPVAQNFFNAYMDYSAHAFEYTRYSNLLSRILSGSSLYDYVYRSQEAMYWASGTQTEFQDLRYDNFHRVSDYCFVCTVIYSADMTAKNWYEQYSYELENAYELAFVSTGGRWLAGGMNVITAA